MSKRILKIVTSVLFALAFTYALRTSAFASIYQIGNSDTSVTINFEDYSSGYTNFRVGIAQLPAGSDYTYQQTVTDTAKANAENAQYQVPDGQYSYTVSGLKAQSTYIVAVAYDYVSSYSGTVTTYTTYSTAFTKIKKVNNVAQKEWYKYIEQVNVTWDAIPSTYSSDVKYEVVFMDAKGKTIEKKTVSTNAYSHSIKNNKIYTVKVRAIRQPSTYSRNMTKETTAWSDVQYLFTQPTVSYAKLANKKLKIKWNKISGVTSYDIYVSTRNSSGYKKVKTVKAKKNSLTIKKFKKKKLKKRKYFVYVVPNKKVNGKVITKDVTYTYEVTKGNTHPSENYK